MKLVVCLERPRTGLFAIIPRPVLFGVPILRGELHSTKTGPPIFTSNGQIATALLIVCNLGLDDLLGRSAMICTPLPTLATHLQQMFVQVFI